MKNIFIIISCSLLLGACNENIAGVKRAQVPQTLTHKAYYYYGLQEVKDRELIKELTGVDPVVTEWCAAFINMILTENSLPTSSTVSPYPLMARSFLEWGTPVNKPEKGDILIFKRGTSGWQGHVAFYVSTNVVNGKKHYSVLGGNQDDSVSIKTYPASDLLGMRRLDLNSINDPLKID